METWKIRGIQIKILRKTTKGERKNSLDACNYSLDFAKENISEIENVTETYTK